MIICDSREKKNSHILNYFDKHNIPYRVTKMAVADYMVEGKGQLVIDRKQNLEEVAKNLVTTDKRRFLNEIRLGYANKIKIVVLVEHSKSIKQLRDVPDWSVTWTDKSNKQYVIAGRKLLDEMDRVSTAYGVEWEFCTKAETPRKILEILGYRSENDA